MITYLLAWDGDLVTDDLGHHRLHHLSWLGLELGLGLGLGLGPGLGLGLGVCLHHLTDEVKHGKRPRNWVAAVDDIVRRLVNVVDQGRLFLRRRVQAHDRLQRSERAGEPGDLTVEPGPGRACLLELAAHNEVRDVREASPERVPGEEGALHLVLLDEAHDRVLVQAQGMLDQVDDPAVRADVLGLARPARGCQSRE